MNTYNENAQEKQRNIGALYPLSPIQGGFLFQALYEKSSDTYFVQMLLELRGELKVDILKQAWSKVLERHESLRASFIWEDLDEPIQVIHKTVDLPWHEEDWSKLTEEDRAKGLEEYIEKDRAQGFDFTRAPLMRWSLFKCDDQKHYLLWSHHHILSDGWSTPIILDEVRSVYDSLANGNNINLPMRRPYGDYIAWLNRQDQKKAEDYWKKTLIDVMPTKLASKIIKEGQIETYREYTFSFNEEASQQLSDYAGELGVTLNTVLQTLWGIMLSAYTGQSDVVFGVTVSGRQIDLSGVESMVGIFINTLPLRVQLKGFESLEDLIKNIQDQMVGMQEHAYIPLWKIQAQQKEGGTGLFDTAYVYQNYPIQNDQNAGLKINNVRGIEKAEYTLGVTLSFDHCLKARVNYNEAYLSQDFIEKILSHFEQLILTIVKNPSQKVGELSLLKPEELKQLTLWNETQHEYQKNKSIHELFEEQVKKTPNNTAIVYEAQELTYHQLNEQANQLAHYLRDLGVEAEVPVALIIERSIEMIIGILGILKAGGVYVPLDVNYPSERLDYMLEDSGVPFVLTRNKELETLSLGHQIVINLDDIENSLKDLPKSSPEHGTLPNNLAYVIYTSGSTGRPKGVGISHGSAGAYLNWAKATYGVKDNKPVLFHGSVCFDMSITSLFVPLLSGKVIKVIKDDFAKMLEDDDLKETFSFIKLTPSHLKLIEESPHYELKDLSDCFIVGGEAFTGEHLTNRDLTLINEYGPTEATVACSIYEVDQAKEYQIIPI
ncbi:MAG: AMP-binding protein, partial [Holosporales bacterium]|nr:AMP-binding protein [Holosporales bacterium]